MADVIYNNFKKLVLNGSINFASDTIKVALVTSSYTPDQDTHDFFNDVTNEVSGTGYVAGGEAVTNPTVTADNTDNEGVFDADNVTWETSTITARGAVVYKDTGNAATSPLVMYKDFGQDYISSGGDFTITWNAEGIINVT